MAKLSIIVPVYNVEPYLRKCLESIKAQTFTDFEAILIDDGSTDQSGTICDEYASDDIRFIVIHQNNSGASAARNKGLDIAKGEYIAFIDSDDWIESEMFEKMIYQAENSKADIVGCDFRQHDGNDYRKHISNKQDFTKQDLLKDVFGTPSTMLGVCWNKIFARRCIAGLGFLEDFKNYEDTIFLCNSYLRCNKAVFLGEKYYVVNVRENSASRKKDLSTLISKYNGCMYLYKWFMTLRLSKDVKQAVANKTLDTLMKYYDESKSYDYNTDEKMNKKIKKTIISISLRSVINRNVLWRQAHGFLHGVIHD